MKNSIFWDVTVPRVMNIYANVIFALLWVGFIAALIVNKEWLDTLWDWVQALPWLPRIIIWLVFLPVMVGLWIWESPWTIAGKLVGLAGIIAWTIIAVVNIYRAFNNHTTTP
jgi:hypothetical protein